MTEAESRMTLGDLPHWEDIPLPKGMRAKDLADRPVRSLHELVGRGYGRMWNWRGRYIVIKGSRSSKKSYTTAYKCIADMMQYPKMNYLVIRKNYNANPNSTFAQLGKAIYNMGVESLWKMNKSPLEMVYLPTGQKIIFGGLDDPQKLASVNVTHGYLCRMWVEEAFQITNEEDFDKVDQSLRGLVDDPIYEPQVTITFNPWNGNHWLKKRFFDREDDDVLAMQVDYRINEFQSSADLRFFEKMKENNPQMYWVAGLGNWGYSQGTIYTDWKEEEFDVDEIRKNPDVVELFGLDFGFTNDPTAFICMLLNQKTNDLYIYDEWYEYKQDNEDIAKHIIDMGYGGRVIYCDSAEPKSIHELKKYGLKQARGALKGGDSVSYGIQKIQQLHQHISPECRNYLMEIQSYTFAEDSKTGKITNDPIDDFNHAMDATRYGVMSRLYAGAGGVMGVIDETMPPSERKSKRVA